MDEQKATEIIEKLRGLIALDYKWYDDYMMRKFLGIQSEDEDKREQAQEKIRDEVLELTQEAYPMINEYCIRKINSLTEECLDSYNLQLESIINNFMTISRESITDTLDTIEKNLANLYNEKMGINVEPKKKKAPEKKFPVKKKTKINPIAPIEIIQHDYDRWAYRHAVDCSNEIKIELKSRKIEGEKVLTFALRDHLLKIMTYFQKDLKDYYRNDEQSDDFLQYNKESIKVPKRNSTWRCNDSRLKQDLSDLIDYNLPDNFLEYDRKKKVYKLNGILFRDGNKLRDFKELKDSQDYNQELPEEEEE